MRKYPVKRFEDSEKRQWERWLVHNGIDITTLDIAEETKLRERLRRENSQICAGRGYRVPVDTRELVPTFAARAVYAL
jgi:hypothetical protein